MQTPLTTLANRAFGHLFALTALALCATAQADAPLRYQCNTILAFGPSHCPGSIAPMHENATVEIDLERKLWKSDHMVGPIESEGSVVTLKKWGAGMAGRDATIDRSSGEFNFHLESGCLVEHQTGTCQPVPVPVPAP